MIKVSQATSRRLLAVHGWSGVILGLALYVVVLTGAIVVFSHELGAWSVSGHQLDDALAGKVDNRLTELSQQVDPEYLHEVSIWQNSAGYIIAFFHTHVQTDEGKLADEGTRFVLDPTTLAVISSAQGLYEEMPAVSSSFLEDFFVDLHIRLHAPDPIGLYLTGILGLVLLVAAISGFILHRHLIKDIFLSPRISTRLLNARDRHNLAGSWGIVFSILLAFTGAFFSFATTLGLPVIALTAFEGDQQKATEVIFGEATVEDATPKAFIGLEPIIAKVRQADVAGSVPVFISIENWGRADATVTTVHAPDDQTIFFSNHQFNGTNGEYLGEKPAVGTEPSLGSTLVGLMGVLHFGWFAGVLSKIIWLSLGLATCYVTVSGLQLWVKRREQQRVWQQLARLISIIVYGTPIAMSTAAIGFLLSYVHYPQWVESWTVNGFFIGVVISFVAGALFHHADKRDAGFQLLLGISLLGLPLMRRLMAESNWQDLLAQGNTAVVALDASFLIAGCAFLLLSSGLWQQKKFSKEKNTLATEVEG